MKKYIYIVTMALIAFSCSIERNLEKQYVGKDLSFLEEQYGEKPVIIQLSETKKMAVYEQTKSLKGTTINQGETTLNPMSSPAVTQKERTIFYLDQNNRITSCKFERTYEPIKNSGKK
jgi:hypothetical protein